MLCLTAQGRKYAMDRGEMAQDARAESQTDVLRPFFGYYGGKWRDTPKNYPLPLHGTIIEPFAGSAGYSLRYPERRIILCELDPIVCGIWTYLTSVSESEMLQLPDVDPDGSVRDLQIPEEARWLIGMWLNRGVSSPRVTPSKWMRSGVRPGSFWGPRVRTLIAQQLPRIRHWEIHNLAYSDCPFAGEATWFIDPPYSASGDHYRFGSRRLDYEALRDWCKARKGQVIVCEKEGADWLPFSPVRNVKTTRRGHRTLEVVWLR